MWGVRDSGASHLRLRFSERDSLGLIDAKKQFLKDPWAKKIEKKKKSIKTSKDDTKDDTKDNSDLENNNESKDNSTKENDRKKKSKKEDEQDNVFPVLRSEDEERFHNINIFGNSFINRYYLEINDHGNMYLLHDTLKFEKYCTLLKIFKSMFCIVFCFGFILAVLICLVIFFAVLSPNYF